MTPNGVLDAAPTPADVRAVYRLLLGREAESDAVVAWHCSQRTNLRDLIAAFIGSTEYRIRMGINADEPALAGALRARIAAMPGAPVPSGHDDPIGMVAPDWHQMRRDTADEFAGRSIEWLALLDAVAEARERLTVVELGCAHAPWLVRAALAARRLHGDAMAVTLVGVEGEPDKIEKLFAHFQRNGIDPAAARIWPGAIGVTDGAIDFETSAGAHVEWGTRPVGASDDPFLPRVRAPRVTRVPCWTLATVLRDLGPVDFLHIDIQGDEAAVIDAGAETVARQVRRLLVGTHGRGVEQALMQRLVALDFMLVREKSCRLTIHDGRPMLSEDGAQYWRNRALTNAGA